jgi:hypothetical protein
VKKLKNPNGMGTFEVNSTKKIKLLLGSTKANDSLAPFGIYVSARAVGIVS